MDWSRVFEVALGSFLGFVFGLVLQARLLRRQERFQKELLERQLAFLEKLERDRAASEESREKSRAELRKSIAAAKLDHASMLHFIDRMEDR